ncbi:hypothetical protein ACFPOU_14495 [Massilia jejuensis]|uniref:Uncharacterized protein n=1 Tax=Massilia jejuensis TaxID=648894 RepID=A0ABW0PL17_9BURK
MKQSRGHDPTRRHAAVTAGLGAVALLVIVLHEDPAARGEDARAAAAQASTQHRAAFINYEGEDHEIAQDVSGGGGRCTITLSGTAGCRLAQPDALAGR